MHVTFILTSLYDPYAISRIENIRRKGADTVVFGFKRKTSKGTPLHGNVTSLGYTEHGKYYKRIPAIIKSFFTVRKKVETTDVVYCTNLQTLLIGWLFCTSRKENIQLVYDVADVREVLIKKNFSSFFMRMFERFLINRTSIVVVTAPAYIDGYFKKIQRLLHTDYHIIENKIDASSIIKTGETISLTNAENSDTLTIGYFGVLRCKHSLELLYDVVQAAEGRIRLYLRGFFIEHLELNEQDILDSQYVTFGGSFVSPDDLQDIYSKIDLCWTAIYHAKSNVMWSRTNRFYQACYFRSPMITQQGTPDASQVEKHNIGFSIDLLNKRDALAKILSIKQKEIDTWKKNSLDLPEHIYVLTDEYDKLLEKLKAKQDRTFSTGIAH